MKAWKSGFSSLVGGKRLSRLTSKQSMQFFDKRLIIKQALNMEYVVSGPVEHFLKFRFF